MYITGYKWDKCFGNRPWPVLHIDGQTEAAYIHRETPMTMYANVNAALEQMRRRAEAQGTRGPRVRSVLWV